MAKKKLTKKQQNQIKRDLKKIKKKNPKLFYVLVILIIVSLLAVGFIYWMSTLDQDDIAPSNETSIILPSDDSHFRLHVLELDNDAAGDSLYIQAGNIDILIDAGSRASSSAYIANYLSNYVKDGKLEYVIATHSDQDHIAGFVGTTKEAGILDRYDIGTLIDFSYVTNETQLVKNYWNKVEERLSTHHIDYHYSAKECIEGTNGAKKHYDLLQGMTMDILSQRYYFEKSSSDNNNHSVCTLFQVGEVSLLLTGDLEKSGESSLIEQNPQLSKVQFFKAGHHGSPTSSNDNLLQVIQPEVIAVSAVAGRTEYTKEPLNTFPSQAFIDRAGKYTEKIYCTREVKIEDDQESYQARNGTIIFDTNGVSYEVICTNDSTILKESTWFKNNRTWPNA